jgi:hypothetical protein
MPLTDRRYMGDEHPPHCTCQDCLEKCRLEKQFNESGISYSKYPLYETQHGEIKEHSLTQAYFCLKCNKYVNVKKIYKPFKFGAQGVKCKTCGSLQVELREWKR